jgi:hypothetical protein
MIVSTPVKIPVTTPPVVPFVTVAVLLLLLHVPPVAGFVKTIVEPMQTDEEPAITPAFGNALTDTTIVAAIVPQLLVTVYDMVVVPAAIAATIPVVEPIVATAVFTDVQTPPLVALLKVVLPEGHTVAVPVIVPAFGEGLTVTTIVAAAVPQLLVTEYDIVVVPAVTPVTIPEDEPIVAIAGVTEDHTPPVVALLNVVVLVGQTVAVPVIVPAAGSALTDTIFAALHPVANA